MHRLSSTSGIAAPPRFEAQAPEFVHNLIPGCFGGMIAEQIHRTSQRITQALQVVDISIQHQLLIPVAVYPQEFEYVLSPLSEFLKQMAGQTSIQKFDTASDRSWFMQLVELAIERSQINLQHELVVMLVCDQALLELEELSHRNLFEAHGLNVDPNIAPACNSTAQRQHDPGMIHHSFLAYLKTSTDCRQGLVIATFLVTQCFVSIEYLAA